jgi:GTP1/Obg family GTP-binding protein
MQMFPHFAELHQTYENEMTSFISQPCSYKELMVVSEAAVAMITNIGYKYFTKLMKINLLNFKKAMSETLI